MFDNEIIAYFSMEVALEDKMPTYSGGLGVLAGDFLITAADMRVPLVGISLLHQTGYFLQKIDENGNQIEEPDRWSPEEYLTLCKEEVAVRINERQVRLRVWKYEIISKGGFVVPVYFLDSHHLDNNQADRDLCSRLYNDDPKIRLSQEVILGCGGLRLLEELGYRDVKRYHLNEGHASLLAIELLKNEMDGDVKKLEECCQVVRSKCVFTTHTPVPAGHDKFSIDLAKEVLGRDLSTEIEDLLFTDQQLNMTFVALNLSGYINGVAKRHGEIAQEQNVTYDIESITNGVHAKRWVSPSFRKLFDKTIPGWQEDNFSLRSACGIEKEAILQAHKNEKRNLIDFVNVQLGQNLSYDLFTLGFARRATGYKRADLLFFDTDRLLEVSEKAGPIQCIFAGKAHPKDLLGKEMIQKIFSVKDKLGDKVKIAYLPNYDTALAKLLVSGVDLWLNNPQRPLEASGTSGMKAALNGVPSLSVLDGWWIEGCVEAVTGWTIGKIGVVEEKNDDAKDAASIYRQLEENILPLYYQNPEGYAAVQRNAIAINGSFFNTQRMMQQYVLDAYF